MEHVFLERKTLNWSVFSKLNTQLSKRLVFCAKVTRFQMYSKTVSSDIIKKSFQGNFLNKILCCSTPVQIVPKQ